MSVMSPSPEPTPSNLPDPLPAAAYRLGGHSQMLPDLLVNCNESWEANWDASNPSNRAWSELVVNLNEMDAAVIVLGARIEDVIRDDVRKAISLIKNYADPEVDLHDSIRYASVLSSELNRAFMSDQSLRTWYNLGRAIGEYQHWARIAQVGGSLPDFGFVLDAVRLAYKERGSEIQLLRKLIELDPELPSINLRQLLDRVLDWNEHPSILSCKEDVLQVQMQMLVIYSELYHQLTELTSPVVSVPLHPLTRLQERILREVREKALKGDNLEQRLKVDRKRLYRDGITPLKKMGLLENDRSLGGYYDPLYPPKKNN